MPESREGKQLIIIFLLVVLPGPRHRRNNVTYAFPCRTSRDEEEASLLLRSLHEDLKVFMASVEKGSDTGTHISVSSRGRQSSDSQDHHNQGTSRTQESANAHGADAVFVSSEENNNFPINSGSVSTPPRNDLQTSRPVSNAFLQILNSILRLSTSAHLPSPSRLSFKDAETRDVNPARQPPLPGVDMILIQYDFTSDVLCSSDPNNNGVIHLPREASTSSVHDTLSIINIESTKPEEEMAEVPHKQSISHPFWPKLFSRLVNDDQSSVQEMHPEEILRNADNCVLNPVIRDILILLMALMTIVFKHLHKALGAAKVNKNNNVLYIKFLTKSFFMKWTWAHKGHHDSSAMEPIYDSTSEKSSTWKRLQFDKLKDFILRPWLTKATSRQCQPCCSSPSSSSSCSACQQQLKSPLSQTQRTVQVGPAFLPNPTGNPSFDLAHLGYRLATLAMIPPGACPVYKTQLADAGFYSLGNGDETICYSCGVRHSGWRAGDNALDIHRQLSPACQHVLHMDQGLATPVSQSGSASHNGLATASASGSGHGHVREVDPSPNQSLSPEEDSEQPPSTTRSTSATTTTSTTNTSGSHARIPPSSNESSRTPGTGRASATPGTRTTTRTTTTVSRQPSEAASAMPAAANRRPLFPRPALDLGGSVYPAYHSMAQRRRTFTQWDDSRAPALNELLMSGMFYAGYADCVRCFYCGVGLKNWVVNDNVWHEHVRYRPDCEYLRATKGDHFIRDIQRRLGIEPSSSTSAQRDGGSQPPPAPENGSQPTSSASGQSQQQFASSSSQHPPHNSSNPTATITTNTTNPSTNTTTNNNTNARSSSGAASSNSGPTGSLPPASASSLTPTSSSTETAGPVAAAATARCDRQPPPLINGAMEEREMAARLQTDNARLSQQVTCRTCRVTPIDVILFPCAHLVLCESCARSVTSCPLCHQEITSKFKVTQG